MVIDASSATAGRSEGANSATLIALPSALIMRLVERVWRRAASLTQSSSPFVASNMQLFAMSSNGVGSVTQLPGGPTRP